MPDGRTAASVYNSIIGDELNKRTIVFNTGASKIKKQSGLQQKQQPVLNLVNLEQEGLGTGENRLKSTIALNFKTSN
jgi:hypothetical protein